MPEIPEDAPETFDPGLDAAKHLAALAVGTAESPVMEAARIKHATAQLMDLMHRYTLPEPVRHVLYQFHLKNRPTHELDRRARFLTVACSLVDPHGPGPETVPALRKLLEAMDAALRV